MKKIFFLSVFSLFVMAVSASTGLNKFNLKETFTLDGSKLSEPEVEKESLDVMCTTYRVVHDCNGDGAYDYDYTGCFESFSQARALAIQFSNSCGQQ